MAKSENTGKPCIIEGCERVCSPRSKLPICENCRQTIGRWEYRRPTEVLIRKQFLTKSQNRMGNVSGGKRRAR